jgi:predicted nucleic acid-binding protein
LPVSAQNTAANSNTVAAAQPTQTNRVQDAGRAGRSAAVAGRYQGAHNTPKEKRVRLLAEAAKVCGEYVSRPTLKQKPRNYPDTQIAAIALSRGLIVATRNTQDFPEVPVLNPFED